VVRAWHVAGRSVSPCEGRVDEDWETRTGIAPTTAAVEIGHRVEMGKH
jgi:hypothetical protein